MSITANMPNTSSRCSRGSGSRATQRATDNDLLAHDLVYELQLMISHVGAGTPIFKGQPPVSLRLIDTRMWDGSGNVLVRYEAGRRTA